MSRLSFLKVYALFQSVKSNQKTKDLICVSSLLDGNSTYSFSQSLLIEHRTKTAKLLSQVNDNMKQTKDLRSQNVHWIMARYNWSGMPWTESLEDVDLLLAIGRASEMVKICYPKKTESLCTMAYATIANIEAMHAERMYPPGKQIKSLAFWNYNFLRKKE